MQARIQATLAKPGMSPVIEAARHDAETGGGVLGAAVAFRLFLFMVPYAFVVVTLLGYAQTTVSSSTTQAARDAGIGGIMLKAISGSSHLSGGHRLFALFGGAFALLLAARALLKVLRITHALIWRVPVPKPRKTVQPVLLAILVVTVALGLAALVGKIRSVNVPGGIAATLIFVAIPGAVWFAVSIYLPHESAPRWALVPGAVVVAVGFEVLHLITVYWLPVEIEHKSATYGAIATSLAMLAWAALVGRLLTGSAVVNATLWRRYTQRLSHPHPLAPVPETPTAPLG
jgi:uncharacterized BrkB/YihY/UPF0761 family membrane protein